MKICVIYNVKASQALKHDLRPDLDAFFAEQEMYKRLDFNPAESDFDDLLSTALSDKFETLVLVGGDGTLRSGVNFLHQREIIEKFKVVFIPYGTGNLMRDALNLPTDTAAILQLIKNDNFLPYRYGVYDKEVFLVGASVGNISTLAEINQQPWFKKIFGKLSYVLKLLVASPTFKNKSFEALIGYSAKTYEAHSVLITPGNFVNGFMEANGVKNYTLGVSFLRFGYDWVTLVKTIYSLLFYGEFPSSEVLEVDKITLSGKNLEPLQLDGDLLAVGNVSALKFEIGKSELNILSFKNETE